MSLKDWAAKKNRELHRHAMEDRDTHAWHSSAYHRFFEGYQETETVDEKGHRQIRRVYMGTVWRQALPTRRYVLLRIGYALLLILTIAALVLAGRQEANAATAFYVVLTEMATICLLAWTGYTLVVNYLFIPREMTVHDYRASHVALSRASFWLTVAFGADILTSLLACLLQEGSAAQALFFLMGAVAAGLLCLAERRVPYEKQERHSGDETGSGIVIENDLA